MIRDSGYVPDLPAGPPPLIPEPCTFCGHMVDPCHCHETERGVFCDPECEEQYIEENDLGG